MDAPFNWNSLIQGINYNGIVPVIGNDLSVIRLKKSAIQRSDYYDSILSAGQETEEYIFINLYKYLSFKLWETYGLGTIPAPLTLNNITSILQRNDVKENQINNLICNEIVRLTDEQILLEPYRKLSRISGFETYITVNFDNFLKRAFETENKHLNKSFNFYIPIDAVSPDDKRDVALPKIYNLMGSIDGFKFALSDEDALEYLYRLQDTTDSYTKELFDSINHKDLLIIGSSFPDWFMRFFIRIISNERFKNGEKAKYVTCDQAFSNTELITFLRNNSIKVIPINVQNSELNNTKVYKSSIEFVDELFERWNATTSADNLRQRFKEQLFISYSRDDKNVAEKLKNEFNRNGVRVFFDTDTLKTGDRFNQLIIEYIKDCDFFLPIISKNAIENTDRYVYDKEWKRAIILDSYKNSSYIRPFIIDSTSPTDTRIPEEFRNLSITHIEGIDNFSAVVRKFIQENNLTPILS